MDEYKVFAQKAKKVYTTADHLAYMTLPMLNDDKLLLIIAENTYLSLTNGMDAFLHYEKQNKKIQAIPDSFELKFHLFKTKCVEKYNIDKNIERVIRELRDIVKKHKNSAMEFTRKNQIIICSRDYSDMISIDIRKLKNYLTTTRNFIQKLSVLNKNV